MSRAAEWARVMRNANEQHPPALRLGEVRAKVTPGGHLHIDSAGGVIRAHDVPRLVAWLLDTFGE